MSTQEPPAPPPPYEPPTPPPPPEPPASPPPPPFEPPSEPPPPPPPPAPPAVPPASQPPAVPPAGAPSNLADWGTRAIGAVIDWLPVFIVELVTYRVPFIGLLSLAYWAYLGHLEGVTGQTPGKAMQGTRLVDQNGELLGSGQGIGRKFLHIIDWVICGLGFLLPIIDAKRQTIADKVVNSYVVTGIEKKPFNVSLWTVPKP